MSMRQLFDKHVDKTLYGSLLKYGKALPIESFENIMRGPLQSDGSLYAIRMQRLRNIIGPATSYNDYLNTLKSPEFNSLLNQRPKYDKQMLRFIGGMVLQQGIGSIAEYMQASENQNVATAGGAL